MIKRCFFTVLTLVLAIATQAQMVDPVHFKSELKTKEGSPEGEIVFTATIDGLITLPFKV